MSDDRAISDAVAHIRSRDPRVPSLAMILGSGLGRLADSASHAIVIPGDDIPSYPVAGVAGHHGDLVIGELGDVTVAFMRGRFHAYEGYSVDDLTFPVRLLAALGATHLILTNAAGSLHADMPQGSLMRITDHINLAGRNPLSSLGEDSGFRRSRSCFDPDWGRIADQIAERAGIPVKRGVYLWILGPSYETPAEIRFFQAIGADAVGMSTVPEATVASRLGLKVLGLSAVTNLAAGLGDGHLDHDDVLEVGAALNDTMRRLVTALAYSVADDQAGAP